jgi:replication-associated recombination protein RarA
MESHLALSDDNFETEFYLCKFPASLFTHEAHLRLAWIHVKKYGCDIAVENITKQLFHFVESIEVTDKYNQTLTCAAIKAVNHFINKSASTNFPDFINEFPRLKTNFKELMAFHYKIDIYNSALAKQQYLEPDLVPF